MHNRYFGTTDFTEVSSDDVQAEKWRMMAVESEPKGK